MGSRGDKGAGSSGGGVKNGGGFRRGPWWGRAQFTWVGKGELQRVERSRFERRLWGRKGAGFMEPRGRALWDVGRDQRGEGSSEGSRCGGVKRREVRKMYRGKEQLSISEEI